jgi:malonyl-CoA/methylmalonyl-CoA synthetase
VSNITLLERAASNFATTAIFQEKNSWTYADILETSSRIAAALLGDADDLREQRVAFLLSPGFYYVAVQWAIWRAGGVAMPLSLSATEPELEHYLSDAAAVIVVTEEPLRPRVETLCERLDIALLLAADMAESQPGELPAISEDRRAMMLYTSGTTSKPKGVVATHRNIEAQVRMLVEAWQWRADDRIPLFLPLHHVHGIVNVLTCALWSGASIEVFESFDAGEILARVADGAFTLFMAVPTIYVKLIQAIEAAPPVQRELRNDRDWHGYFKSIAWRAPAGFSRSAVAGRADPPGCGVRRTDQQRRRSGRNPGQRPGGIPRILAPA